MTTQNQSVPRATIAVSAVNTPITTQLVSSGIDIGTVEQPVTVGSVTNPVTVSQVNNVVTTDIISSGIDVINVVNPITVSSVINPVTIDQINNVVTTDIISSGIDVYNIVNPVTVDSVTNPVTVDSIQSGITIDTINNPTPTMEYPRAVSRDLISGERSVNKFARATKLDATDTDIWDGARSTANQPIWLAPTQARIHDITSTSTDDDGSPQGTGAWTVQIWGLTDWSTSEVTETVTMNGTSNVATSNAYVIIYRMEVTGRGVAGPNVGDISATAQVDSSISAYILAGKGQTQMAIYAIPDTETIEIDRFYANLNKTGASGGVNISMLVDTAPTSGLNIYTTKHTFGIMSVGTSAFTIPYKKPKIFAGPALIKIQGNGSASNFDVSAGFDAIIKIN